MREMEKGSILLKPEERDLKAYHKYCSTLTHDQQKALPQRN